jgi:3-methyl-2-oxobutanoate hydroxymethyltransferase
MSQQPAPSRRLTIRDLALLKGTRPLVSLTAYTAPMARLLDEYVDMLLVGDSLGMVVYGMESTLPVSVDDMIRHGKTVMQHSRHACVIVDMPFGSYQHSPQDAFLHATRIMKETGCAGVKLEGGAEMADTVRFLSERAIPVMAHIGLKPQHVNSMGGYRYQGRNQDEVSEQLHDAQTLEAAGAWGLLLEGMEAALARTITEQSRIPTIGIGAGNACDGQILVTEDMLGLSDRVPKFVKKYGDMKALIQHACASYKQEVSEGSFPSDAHSYNSKMS